MKLIQISILITILMCTGFLSVYSQEKTDKILTKDEVAIMAEFPGGRDSLGSFLRENIQYPRRAIMNGEKGQVYVAFVVGKKGEISDIKLSHTEKLKRGSIPGKIESTGEKIKRPLLEKEAIRVIKTFPNFTPAKNKKGEIVRVEIILPITFWVGGQ